MPKIIVELIYCQLKICSVLDCAWWCRFNSIFNNKSFS